MQSQSFNDNQQQKQISKSSNNLDQCNKIFKQTCVTDRIPSQQSSAIKSQQMLNSTRLDVNSSSPIYIDCFNCQNALKYDDLQNHSEKCARTNPCIDGLDKNAAVQQINSKLERINTYFSLLLKEQKRLNIKERRALIIKEIIQKALHSNLNNIESLISEINQEFNNFNRNALDYLNSSAQQIKSIISLKISVLTQINQTFSPIRSPQQNNFFVSNNFNTKQKKNINNHIYQQSHQQIDMKNQSTLQSIQQNASAADIYFLNKESTQNNGFLSPQAEFPHAKQKNNLFQLIKSSSSNYSTNPFSNYLEKQSNFETNKTIDNQSNCDTNNTTKSSLEIKNQMQGGNYNQVQSGNQISVSNNINSNLNNIISNNKQAQPNNFQMLNHNEMNADSHFLSNRNSQHQQYNDNNQQQQTNTFYMQQNNNQQNNQNYSQNFNRTNKANSSHNNTLKLFENKLNEQQINFIHQKPNNSQNNNGFQNKQQYKEDSIQQNKLGKMQGSISAQSFAITHQPYLISQTYQNQQPYLNQQSNIKPQTNYTQQQNQQSFSQKDIINSNIIQNSRTFKTPRNPYSDTQYQGSFLTEEDEVKRSNNHQNNLQTLPNQYESIDGTASQDSKRDLLNKLVQKQKDLQNLQQLSQKLKKNYENNQEEINKVYSVSNLNSSKSPLGHQRSKYQDESSISDQYNDMNQPKLRHQNSSQSNSSEITQSSFLSPIQLGSLNDLMNEEEKQLQSVFFNLCYYEKNNYPKSHISQRIPISLLFKEALDMNIRDEEQMKYFIQYAFENATTYIDVDKVKRQKKNQIFKNNLANKVKLIHQ